MNSHPGSTTRLSALRLALLALALVLSSIVPSDAKKGPPPKAAQHSTGAWQVLPPITYKNLTLFPVRAASQREAAAQASLSDYITLDEGLKRGTVVITERGSGQMASGGGGARRGRLQGMVNQLTSSGSSDSVNQLALVNRSGKKLLLLAGEVITGGKQDRIVEEDLIIPPVSVAVSLNVFCVEPGRWQHRGGGTSGSAAGEPAHQAANEQAAQAANGPAVQRREAAPAVAAPAGAADSFSSLGAIAHPKLRAAAQEKKDQSSVWDEVRANNAKLGTTTGTETYREVYDKREVGDQMRNYIAAFEREVAGPGIVGVVVARNGELIWADCFMSDTLFAKYWPKLLKSYVVDALGEAASEKRPTVEQAQRYLQVWPVKTVETGQAGIYSLRKWPNPNAPIFALYDNSLAAPLLLHFNKMQR